VCDKYQFLTALVNPLMENVKNKKNVKHKVCIKLKTNTLKREGKNKHREWKKQEATCHLQLLSSNFRHHCSC